MEKTFIKIQKSLINTRNVTKFEKTGNYYIKVTYNNVISYMKAIGAPDVDFSESDSNIIKFDSKSERDKAFEKLEAILSCVTLLD